jgi:hypothetical protein
MSASDPITELVDTILWPKLDSAAAAKKAARQGAYYNFMRVGIYAVSAIRSLGRPTENLFRFGAAAYAIESVILIVFGILIFRLSRAAAVIGLLEYLVNLIVSVALGLFRGIVLPFWVVFAFFFVNSVRGTYAYRRFMLEATSSQISVK